MGEGDERIDLVRSLYERFRTGDNETPFDDYAEDIVWEGEIGFPFSSHYEGHDGVREFWRDWLQAWQAIEWDREELSLLDDGRVRAVVRNQRNQGRETGIWLEQKPYEQFWTIEDGKVTHLEFRWLEEPL
jgi:ketosteroid isomerase-like protein